MTRRLSVLFAASVCLVVLGLAPLSVVAPLGDDPITIAEGLARLWGSGSLASAVWESAAAATTGDHVLPVGGALTAIEIYAAQLLMHFGLSLAHAWGILRLLAILVSLLSFAWMLGQLLTCQNMRCTSGTRWHLTVVCFMLTSGWFLAVMQIHAPISQDPLLSYAIVSWVAPAAAFLYVGALAAFLNSTGGRPLPLVVALLLGIFGVFTYEPVVVAIALSIPLVAVWNLGRTGHRVEKRRQLWALVPALVVLAVFSFAQVWRLTQPLEYSGTTPGFLQMTLPTWVNSMLGLAPLTTANLVVASVPQIWMILFYTGISSTLIIGGIVVGRQSVLTSLSSGLKALIFLWLFVSGVVVMFSISVKYQLEIGQILGRTYLFYGLGLLVLAGTLAIFVLWTMRWRMASVAAVALALGLAIPQWALNSRALVDVEMAWSWTLPLINSLDGQYSDADRCRLIEDLTSREIPAFFVSGVEEGLQRSYFGRYQQPFCAKG